MSCEQRGVGRIDLVDEEVVELARQPRAGRRMPRDRVDQVDAVLHALRGADAPGWCGRRSE